MKNEADVVMCCVNSNCINARTLVFIYVYMMWNELVALDSFFNDESRAFIFLNDEVPEKGKSV